MSDDNRTHRALRDVIRVALAEEGLRLPDRAERRVVDRTVELLELAGYELIHPDLEEER